MGYTFKEMDYPICPAKLSRSLDHLRRWWPADHWPASEGQTKLIFVQSNKTLLSDYVRHTGGAASFDSLCSLRMSGHSGDSAHGECFASFDTIASQSLRMSGQNVSNQPATKVKCLSFSFLTNFFYYDYVRVANRSQAFA